MYNNEDGPHEIKEVDVSTTVVSTTVASVVSSM